MPVFELKEIRYFNKCQIFSISREDWTIHLFKIDLNNNEELIIVRA